MSSALRELIAFFGVEVDDKKLDKTNEKLEGLVGLAESVGGAIGIAFGLHEVTEFIVGQVELGAQLAHTSEILGLTVGDLQAFEYAAKNAGLSAEEADTALRFLNKNLGEAATGNATAAQAFEKLGAKVKDATGKVRPTQDVLADVADGIAKLPSPAEKTAKAMEIFGRAGARMIPLLNKGSKGIAEFYDEFEQLGGGIDEEFVQAAEEGEHQMNKLSLAFKGAKATIANALLPSFGWLVSKITDVVGWFRQLSTHSYIVQTTLAVLGGIMVGLIVLWGVLNIEVLLAVVALALLVLIVDDIYTAFMGGKSVIGDFIDSLFGVGATQAVVTELKEDADALYTAFLTLVDGVDNVNQDLEELGVQGGLAGVWMGAMKGQLEAVRFVFQMLRDDIEFVTDALGDLLFAVKRLGKEKLQAAGLGGLADMVTSDDGAPKPQRLDRAARHMLENSESGGFAAPSAGGGAGNHYGDVIRRNEINVDVKGGDSPKETGQHVAAGVKHALDGADTQSAFAAVPGAGF